MKKLCFFVIILTVAAVAFAGGGQSAAQTSAAPGVYRADPNLNAPGVFPICKETVTLKLGVPQSSQVIDWATNWQTKQLEQRGNFKLEFEVFPSAEYAQQLNLMVAAGGNDLPDVILGGLNDARVFQYGLARAIIPLNDYYEHSAYYITEAKKSTGVDFVPMITSPDGNIYAMANYQQILQNEYPCKWWIYKPWLDKLGLKAPGTTGELYEVLKAFKERDPNGNGLADEIPLIDHKDNWNEGVIKALISPFQYVPSRDWFTVENRRVGVAYNTPGFRDAMRYIRSLVAEDLLTPLTFTQDREQMVAILNNQLVVVGMHVWMAMSMLPASEGRIEDYIGIPPLKSADGTVRTPWAPTIASPEMAISKNCRTPEAAFRLGDLLTSEEFTIISRWGQEGVDWVKPDPGEVSMFPAYPPLIKTVTQWGAPQNQYWAQRGPGARPYSIGLSIVFNGDTNTTSYQAAIIQDAYTDNRPQEHVTKLLYTIDEERIATEILLNLDAYVKESIARFAVGELNVDRDWDSKNRKEFF